MSVSLLYRVLLISGDREHCQHVRDELAAHSIQIDEAHSLDDGFHAIGAVQYDAVLMDLGLPDADPRRVVDCLGDIPCAIIICKGTCNGYTIEEMISAGADDVIMRKASGDVLRRAIRYAIEHQRRVRSEQGTRAMAQRVAELQAELEHSRLALAAMQAIVDGSRRGN